MPNHERLIPALMHYDLVGFQTDGDSSNFARYLATECGMPAYIPRRIGVDDRTMRVGAFPVGIETREFQRRARRAVRSEFVKAVRASVPGSLILGVDRLDYTKGLTLRFDGFERFLMVNPQWQKRVYLRADRAEKPLRHLRIRADGARNPDRRRTHQRHLWRCGVDTAALRQPPLHPHRAGGALPAGECRHRHAVARRHESGRQGVRRRTGRRRSGRADPVAVCRRGGGVRRCADRQSVRSGGGRRGDLQGAGNAAGRADRPASQTLSGAARQRHPLLGRAVPHDAGGL